jgi:hypothetical protein
MRALAPLLFAAALSCGGSGVTAYATEQSASGACDMPATTLTGTMPPGASCSTADVCAPACCNCQTGATSLSFNLSACEDGVCAQDDIVCEDAQNGSLCP